jgi:DNA-directed RNA polymerase specialized sigma24 family protein
LLVLRLVEERPYKEIAQRLHCTPVAARLRVSRSLRRLHFALGGF